MIYPTITKLQKFSFSLNWEIKLYLLIYVYNPSNGLPDTNTLNTSYSSISFSIIGVIGHGLSAIFVLISIIPNNHTSAHLDLFARSSMVSPFANNTPRSPKSSRAHALINHSTDFLLITEAHLLMKSSKFVYGQLSCFSFWMTSPISNPNPLIQKNHNLISFPIAAT